MKAFSTLFRVEFRLSLRDMNMPIFAVIMPVVVMLVVGMMFGDQPAYEGASYTFVAQSVGAVSAIGICAGGAMGLPLVVSNYRHRKILKRYFVTPVSVHTILAVQVAIYTVYALISAVLVFGVAALFFGYAFTGSWPAFVGSYVLVLAAMLALGMMVGGLAPNEKVAGVLPHAAAVGDDAALRDDAHGRAARGRPAAAHPGREAAESHVARTARRPGRRAGGDHGGVGRGMHRDRRAFLQVGVGILGFVASGKA